MTLAAWLGDAAAWIEKNGWWRGSIDGPNGRQVCALGAILYCRGLSREQEADEDVREVAYAMCMAIGLDTSVHVAVNEMVTWNDHEAKDRQNVVDMFRKAEKTAIGGFDPDKGVPL